MAHVTYGIRKCITRLIKTTMRYHCTPVGKVRIPNTVTTKCWAGCGARGTNSHWWEFKGEQALWKTRSWFPPELDTPLPRNSAITLQGIVAKGTEKFPARRNPHMVFIAAFFKLRKLERTETLFSRYIDKL